MCEEAAAYTVVWEGLSEEQAFELSEDGWETANLGMCEAEILWKEKNKAGLNLTCPRLLCLP